MLACSRIPANPPFWKAAWLLFSSQPSCVRMLISGSRGLLRSRTSAGPTLSNTRRCRQSNADALAPRAPSPIVLLLATEHRRRVRRHWCQCRLRRRCFSWGRWRRIGCRRGKYLRLRRIRQFGQIRTVGNVALATAIHLSAALGCPRVACVLAVPGKLVGIGHTVKLAKTSSNGLD